MLAHVDRSGYVCGVTLIGGSGIGEVDHAVLNAVRFWRLVPAQSRGEPVESLFRGVPVRAMPAKIRHLPHMRALPDRPRVVVRLS